jgi:hypothetical protein
MKKYPLLAVTCLFVLSSYAQQTYTYRDPQQKFNLAKEYFAKEQYNLAYPPFKGASDIDTGNRPAQ